MKKYSHSNVTKITIFLIAVLCFLGIIKALVEVEVVNNGYFTSVLEEHYIESEAFNQEYENNILDLIRLLSEYKNEEHIRSGGSISEEEWRITEEELFLEYQYNSPDYQSEQSETENFARFQDKYKDKISQAREALISEDLREFHSLLQNLETNEGLLFYATDRTNLFANTKKDQRGQFESYPAYMIFEGYKQEVFPQEVTENESFYRLNESMNKLDLDQTVIYIAFTEKYIDQKTQEWQESKSIASKNLYQIVGYSIGFFLSFIYLIVVIGRKSFTDQEIHFHIGDRIYNDIHILLTISLIAIYIAMVDSVFDDMEKIMVPISIPIIIISLSSLLTLLKQIKNKSLFKHTLIYICLYKLIHFTKEVYHSGSVGRKTVMIVIGYPILIALTFFIFPVTIGFAAWFALKKVKSFQTIQEGVEIIKEGNLHHRIPIQSEGEFGKLAGNINSITDGLNKAVENELKSERLKSELITNVSHDIRTPLTSIITYVDLLKNEKDPAKIISYTEVLDQKSKRLKALTDDLFEAAKASSGNVPVQFGKIDIISLITQGLGEVSDKIEAHDLDFKLSYPNEKIYLHADGKLLWRSIENLLSNIFKYSLKGSRVYISIEDMGSECLITFKNISAFELNISSDELMERFKRGDESRSSQGSGLGLSIAKSLIEIQKGKFNIQIDGDLFKAIIYLPKHER